MSMTDPIADLLTRVRNGAHARKEYIECPWSAIKERVARVMVDEGFLRDVGTVEVAGSKKKDLRVWLRYDARQRPAIRGVRRVSRPSARIYVGAKEMPTLRGGMGINIISTPVGVLVDREAVRRNVGGEIICAVW
ncbi:MAG TPA: 30S ribosomal protein S8 [Candidatus Dormibacteraeota bacterium]|nr:30S ribosomal protein S8 [Candidatus Dormibacteraeota bacterium]